MKSKEVLSTGQAAKLAFVSQQTIIRICDNKTLPSFRLPGSKFRRVFAADLRNYLVASNIPTVLIDKEFPELVPQKLPQVAVDPALIGHTSNPEYEKMKDDPVMEKLRDRTVKVDIPFLEEWEKNKIVEEKPDGTPVHHGEILPATQEVRIKTPDMG